MAEAEENQEAPKGKGKMMIFAVVGVVLLAGGIFAGPMIQNMMNPPAEEPAAAGGGGGEPDADLAAKAHYYPILPPLTSNFADESGRRRFIQVGLEVRASELRFIDAVKEHNAVIRNELLLAYSDLDYTSVTSREGKEELREITLEAIQTVLSDRLGEPGVDDVYFTQFIIQ